MKRIGYFQFCPLIGEVAANRSRIAAALADADADLIVLPELAFTGYCLADRRTAASLAEDPRDSESIRLLEEICRRRSCHVAAGFAERSGEQLYNSAVLVGPGGVMDIYRKIHLFGFESELFDPGSDPPSVCNLGDWTVGMMICFDWFFPETARMLALAGADVIAHPANLVLDWCQKSMVTRCLENNLFAVTANRYGVETRQGLTLEFTGGSQITGPRGRVLNSGPVRGDRLETVEIDPGTAREKALSSGNDLLGDRRPRLYQSLLRPGSGPPGV